MRVISSSVYHFPYCCTTLNADGRVHTFTCLRLFRLFPHTSFYIFSHLCIPFFCLLLFLLFFYRPFPLSHLCVHLLHRPQLYSFARFIRVSPCLFQFSYVSILAQRQASYNSYTSLLPQNSCYHAYFVHFRMVSS